jgi:integrase
MTKKTLVRIWKRPCQNGQSFTYSLIYYDEQCKRRRVSLGHGDKRKAESQAAKLERKLRMGDTEPASMRLSEFLKNSLDQTRGQVRKSTLTEVRIAMESFIKVMGNIDYQNVKHQHGERFMQNLLDGGSSPATVAKKIRHLKRLFQLAVQRGMLEVNSIRYLVAPRVPEKEIHTYSDSECSAMLQTARASEVGLPVRWDLILLTAMTTAMRRGEILNLTWRDIDFDNHQIHINPKENTEYTWLWLIKDNERRSVPLTEELEKMLIDHQSEQPEGYSYVFVPSGRYDQIKRRMQIGNWTQEHGRCPMNNFTRQFKKILTEAEIATGKFHDLRRTCITNWFAQGLSEFEVMKMAGHSTFETTRKYYLAVQQDLLEKSRKASQKVEELLQIVTPAVSA